MDYCTTKFLLILSKEASMLFVFILGGALSLACWTILNARHIRDGKIKEQWGSTFVLAGNKLVGAVYIAIAWGILYAFDKVHFPQSSTFWFMLSITAVLNVTFEILRYRAYQLTTVGLIAPFSAITPVLTIGTSWFILQELPSWQGTVGIFLIAISLYVLHVGDGWSLKHLLQPFRSVWENRGTRYAFLASLPPAVAIVYDKKAVALADPFTFSLFSVLAIGTSALCIEFLMRGRKHLRQQVQQVSIARFFRINIFYAIAVVAFNATFFFTIVPYVSALRRVVIVFEVLLAYIFLKEKDNFRRKIICSIGVVIGVILIGIFR